MALNEDDPAGDLTTDRSTEGVVSLTTIDPDGDVVLKTFRPDGGKHVRVSRHILSLASPVFAKMFNSKFREGLDQHQASPPHPLALPDDDGNAVEVVCNALHYRMEEVPTSLSVECLVNVGIFVDKYDLARALAHLSSTWFRNILESPAADDHDHDHDHDHDRLLFAAYRLDIPEAFSTISWKIICDQVGPFRKISALDDVAHPPNLLGRAHECSLDFSLLTETQRRSKPGRLKLRPAYRTRSKAR